MTLLQICGLSFLAAGLGWILRATGSKAAPAVPLMAGLCLCGIGLSRLAAPLAEVRAMAESGGFSDEFSALCRMLAVGYLTQMTSDICRDMGDATLSARVELCGRAEILLLCLPFLRTLYALATEALS